MLLWGLPIAIMSGLSGSIGFVRAEAPLHDLNLPSVSPEALQDLKDTRTRQDIIQDSLSRYPNRCVCQYQTQDLAGRPCKGRHEVIKVAPRPICYPGQITPKMLSDWRQHHP
jgi:hypothetical protein